MPIAAELHTTFVFIQFETGFLYLTRALLNNFTKSRKMRSHRLKNLKNYFQFENDEAIMTSLTGTKKKE